MFAISLATSFTVESAVSLESLFLQATIAKAEIRIKNKHGWLNPIKIIYE